MASDVSILFGLLLFLILLGIFAPMMQQALEIDATQEDILSLDVSRSISIINTFSAYKGILTSLFWVFDWFPIWLTALHIVIRLTAMFIGVRLIRGTG